MSGHTYTHTHTQDNYSNPRCVHARRGLIMYLFFYDVIGVCLIFIFYEFYLFIYIFRH